MMVIRRMTHRFQTEEIKRISFIKRRVGNKDEIIPADTVVIAAGQDPLRDLMQPLQDAGRSVHLIGGADVAAELDAKRAIHQGTLLAVQI